MNSIYMKKPEGELEVLGAGKYFVALDIPESELVLKVLRPETSVSFSLTRLPHWFRNSIQKIKRTKEVAEAFHAFHLLAKSKTFPFLDCFPETKHVKVNVCFKWGESICNYEGFAYLQGKVEFFGNDTPLNSFNWNTIPEIQYHLWRMGVGLTSPGEVWGPRNWGKTHQGDIRLADMSSLSRDRKKVLKGLTGIARERRRLRLHERQPEYCHNLVDIYMEFLTERLAPEIFSRLWKSGF